MRISLSSATVVLLAQLALSLAGRDRDLVLTQLVDLLAHPASSQP